MTNDESLEKLVLQAKDAVSGLEEPYRMEAFKIILDRLIGGAPDNKKPALKKKARKKANKGGKQKRRDASSETVKSSLDPSTESLKSLKEFYQKHKPDGGEMSAFILSIFLHEVLGKKQFNEADIEYLYRSLISMKVKVSSVSNWRRSLNWLCVKSRKKEWLKRDGKNYQVTNAGLIAFNEIDEKV